MNLKARLFTRPGPWHSTDIRVTRSRGPKGVKVHIDFGDSVSVQLRGPQATRLINAIADNLEN